MKWNELAEGATVTLKEDLLHIDTSNMESRYQYITKAELDAMVTVVHKAGTKYSLDKDHAMLFSHDMHGEMDVHLDTDIDTNLYQIT